MQGISTQANIGSIRAKVDRSISFTVTTPELNSNEKVAFMDLQNMNVTATFVPLDDPEAELKEIKKGVGMKTPSQRMRSVLYILWLQDGQQEAFETYYANRMEQLLDILKRKIED